MTHRITHRDIYTKFMIEYDKALVTSSYPSLTEYEVATVLDKAYNTLIAQKITGNNVRRAPFEADVKAISDLLPLIKHENLSLNYELNDPVENRRWASLPEDFLYYVGCYILIYKSESEQKKKSVPCQIVDFNTARNFFATTYNAPWVKNPVCYIQGNILYILKDDIQSNYHCHNLITLYFIKKPQSFVKNLNEKENSSEDLSYFSGKFGDIEFELNDTMVEELISLAITYALENIESPRLNSKLNMRGLEG